MKSHDVVHDLQTILSSNAVVEVIKQVHPPGEDILAALSEVAAVLQRGPNVELDHLLAIKRGNDVAGGLKSLVALSKYDKQRWLALIDEFGLPIELNAKASSRDIVGKVLAYLDAHPEALHTSKKAKQKTESATLEDTLNKLINYR